MTTFTLRRFEAADLPALFALFYQTVHTVNAKDYSPAQLDAWAPADMEAERGEAWLRSLSAHYSLVACNAQGEILGFGDMDADGYFDRLYVHRSYQGCGIGSALSDALEAYAASLGHSRIRVHASITAKPFYETRGYRVLHAQQVERRGQLLTNFSMEKQL